MKLKLVSFHYGLLIIVVIIIIMIQVVSPIAQKLGKSVLQKCATKLIIPICGML